MKFKDYYQLLGISSTATDAEIKSAFRKQARKYHPDVNTEPGAEERFKDINEANETLKDAKKRAAYDRLRASGIKVGEEIDESRFASGFGGAGGFQGENFSDLFSELFGQQQGGRPRSRKGADVRSSVAVSLEIAHKGGNQRITLTGPSGQRSLEIRVPAGIQPGKLIRLSGQGDPGQGPAAANGDLLLEIQHAAHPHFELTGAQNTDVLFRLALRPWEAALGTKAQVQTLDGTVELAIPAGSNTGRKMRLKGRGFGPQPGDQYVEIQIVNPDELSEADRAAFAALKRHFDQR